jgi:hypothetical protein
MTNLKTLEKNAAVFIKQSENIKILIPVLCIDGTK